MYTVRSWRFLSCSEVCVVLNRYAMIAPTTRIASKPSRRMIVKHATKVATAADLPPPVELPFSSTPSSLLASVRIIVLRISTASLNSS